MGNKLTQNQLTLGTADSNPADSNLKGGKIKQCMYQAIPNPFYTLIFSFNYELSRVI